MDPDISRLNKMFRKMTARKISTLSRLAGLNDEEIQIMRLRWLENKSDIQICEALGMSTATLSRKRKVGHAKIVDALELYGLGENDELPVAELLDYNGLFYKAQDQLIRYFIKHKDDEPKQRSVLDLLTKLAND